jgi:Dehydratase family
MDSKGAFTVGKITEEQRVDVVRHACPGPGACGGMYTFVFFKFFRSHIRRLMECTTSSVRQRQYHELCFGSARSFLAVLLQHPGNLRRYVYMMPQFLTPSVGLTLENLLRKKNSKSVREPRCISRNCSSVISSHGTPGFTIYLVDSTVEATSA